MTGLASVCLSTHCLSVKTFSFIIIIFYIKQKNFHHNKTKTELKRDQKIESSCLKDLHERRLNIIATDSYFLQIGRVFQLYNFNAFIVVDQGI